MSNIYIQEPPALGKRTEAQLKKCWDNIKTRRKAQIALEKREKMKNESSYQPVHTEEILSEEGLSHNDLELLVVQSDSLPEQMEDESHEIEIDELDPEPSVERIEDFVEDDTRSRTIRDEFELRKRNYQQVQEREDELHKLRVREMKLRVLAAEELYKKAIIERKAAEEILKKTKEIE